MEYCAFVQPGTRKLVTVIFPYPPRKYSPSPEITRSYPQMEQWDNNQADRWRPTMVRTATRGVVPAVVINARHIDGKWIEEETGEAFSVPGALWFETEQTNQDASPLKDVFNEDPTDWEEEREHIRQRCGDYC